jgi:signal transduction histidine kinase
LAERAFTDHATHTRFTAKPDDAWEVAVPLGDHRVYGVLSVTVATQQMAKLAAERRRTYALAIASALLLGLGVLWLTTFWVGRPLGELGRAMARARDASTPPPEAPQIGPAEFQVVAQRYNELLQALADRERESQARAALLALEAQARDYDRIAVTAATTAGLAHEIGTPLSTMRGHIQLLRDDLAKSGQAASVERINSLLAQLDRVTDIVRAGMERGAWPQPTLRAADLRDVATRLLRFLEPSLDQAGVHAELARNGSAPGAPAVANCDPALVEQILLNLLKNAIEALPPGGNIRLATGSENGSAYVVVADDGPGLSPEIRAALFNPFITTKGSAGTGLGLAISRRLARALGGELVYVPAARGTEWRLTLPAVKAS